MSDNESARPTYESPVVVALGALQAAQGQDCINGSAAQGDCDTGGVAMTGEGGRDPEGQDPEREPSGFYW